MGAIAGGTMGNAVGNGAENAAAIVVGIVGGAILGDRIEGAPATRLENIQCKCPAIQAPRLQYKFYLLEPNPHTRTTDIGAVAITITIGIERGSLHPHGLSLARNGLSGS